MTGHYQGDLKGLCCHPGIPYFYTVGDDSLLMKWDLVTRKLMKSIKLEYQSMTMDITNDGKYLAIGCHNGNTLIVDPATLVQ
jgi:WD40 repeat protein